MNRTNHTCNCFGLQVVATNLKSAIYTTERNIEEWRGRYVTFVNVHAVVKATEDTEYQLAQTSAVCNFADGRPVVSLQRKKGYIEAGRVAGTDFMEEMLKLSDASENFRHFFYGSNKETLEQLAERVAERYPSASVVGCLAPAYIDEIRPDDFDEIFGKDIQAINDAAPDFVWIGLGAPKQELFMMYASGKINGLMLGVGAAFDFMSGKQKRAPKWMQAIGLEWFFRLLMEPKRLFARYFDTNIKFIRLCLNHKGQ